MARIVQLGPGYVAFDTAPTDEQLAEAWRLLADIDRVMSVNDAERGQQHIQQEAEDDQGHELAGYLREQRGA